jgi:hypothetical protein
LPVVANKYQLISKTSEAFWEFIGSAMGAGWCPDKRPSSLWMKKFNRGLVLIKQNKQLSRIRWSDSHWAYSMVDYKHYDSETSEEFSIEDWEDYKNTMTPAT